MTENNEILTPRPSQLVQAICQVMAEVGYVQQTGVNQQQGYRYASDEDILGAVQPAMARAGLALVPLRVTRADREITTSKGNKLQACDLVITYQLRHISGEKQEITMIGSGLDSLEKAASKALTAAHKSALVQLYCIPTGEAPKASQGDSEPKTGPIPADHWLNSRDGTATYGRFSTLTKELKLPTDLITGMLRRHATAEGVETAQGWDLVRALSADEWHKVLVELEDLLEARDA